MAGKSLFSTFINQNNGSPRKLYSSHAGSMFWHESYIQKPVSEDALPAYMENLENLSQK